MARLLRGSRHRRPPVVAQDPALERHRQESVRASDPRHTEMIAELEGHLPRPPDPGEEHLGFAVPMRLGTVEGELRLITAITTFATAVDINISELRLKAFLPLDEPTAGALNRPRDRRPTAGGNRPGRAD